MIIRHKKKGDVWYSDFIHEGERYSKSWGCITKTVAREKDRKFRTEVLEGKHTLKSRRTTFDTFAEEYLEYARVNKKLKSAKRNEVSVNMLKPFFGGKLLGAIRPFMLEQYKKIRGDKKIKGGQEKAKGTINRDLDLIKNMMRKAVEWGYLSQNPLGHLKRLKEENDKIWELTPG